MTRIHGFFRVSNFSLGIIILLGFMLIIFQPVFVKIGQSVLYQDWYDVEIEVLNKTGETGKPDIKYSREIHRLMEGNWNAWVQHAGNRIDNGSQLCGSSGSSSIYAPQETGITTLSWEYFIGEDCPVPKHPFRVCAEWLMTDVDNTKRFIGPECSDIVDPNIIK